MFMQELFRREAVNGYATAQARYSLNLESKHKQAQSTGALKMASRSIFTPQLCYYCTQELMLLA